MWIYIERMEEMKAEAAKERSRERYLYDGLLNELQMDFTSSEEK